MTRNHPSPSLGSGRVFVTGVGVVSPVGLGRKPFHDALLSGQSGAAPIALFDTHGLDRTIGCEVKDFRPRDFMSAAQAKRAGRASAMAIAATRMAIEEAGLTPEQLAGPRTSVVLGTTMGEANVLGALESAWLHEGESKVPMHAIPRYGTTLLPIHVARAIGARGMVQTMPAACAAGNYAIGYAADQIRSGRADIAVTGASEVIEKLQFAGFVRIGAMAPDRCQPFDQDRRGLLLGEGAGILILESEESVIRRGATPLAEVGGYGLACDAHHITRPDPEGIGSATAMRQALIASGITADQVDFINAHGTGTSANDKVETRVIQEVFGAHQPIVTSVKSMTGHCMGAASAIEAVSCIMTLQDGFVPPTINYESPDPECRVNLVANQTRQADVKVAINNSLAFGGYDAVMTFARPGVLPPGTGMPRLAA